MVRAVLVAVATALALLLIIHFTKFNQPQSEVVESQDLSSLEENTSFIEDSDLDTNDKGASSYNNQSDQRASIRDQRPPQSNEGTIDDAQAASTLYIATKRGGIYLHRDDFESDLQFTTIANALKDGSLEESQIENAKNFLSLYHEQQELEITEELTEW